MAISQGDLSTPVNPSRWNELVDLINSNEVVALIALKSDGTVPLTANWDAGPYAITVTQIISDIAIGTPPIVVTSTTVVPNLNVDQVDGYDLDQALLIASSPTFVGATLSGATTSRLLATDGAKALVSAALASWVTGTANQITVTDDGDGTITLSAPQDLHSSASPTFATLTLSGALIATVDTFADGDATPSVSGGVNFKTANTSPTEITNFDDGVNGQAITIIAGDDDTSIAVTDQTNIKCGAGSGFVLGEYDCATFVHNGTLWVAKGPAAQNSA